MTRRTVLRASDADREQVVERLGHAAAEGRLLPDELEERMGRALSARTYGELDAIVADLPVTRPARRQPRASAWRPPRVVALVVMALVLGLVFNLLSGGVGHSHPGHQGFLGGASVFWVVWIVLGWRYFTRRSHRAHQ
jgi:Domain of unknown function (DUF1707)